MVRSMARGYITGMMLFVLLISPALFVGKTQTQTQATTTTKTKIQATKTYVLAGHKIEVQLVPEKPVFMLGEPIRLAFRVRNLSSQAMELETGADPLSSADRTGFRLEARRDDGMRVLPPPLPNAMACSIVKIVPTLHPGESDTVDLFMPTMLTIRQPGKYTLWCRTELRTKDSMITVETSIGLTILPTDYQAMGEVIDRLGRAATTDMGKSCEPTKAIKQAPEALGAIDDPRVIPWLIRMFGMRNSNRKYEAINTLPRFNSSVAFETLKAGLTVRGVDLDDGPTPADTADCVNSLHVAAVYALAKSAYPEALPALKPLLHDPHDEIREAIVWALDENKSAEAVTMLRVMTHDPNQEIRERAVRHLQ